MPKNIVILLDGTSNEISANRSNILRLYGTLCKSDAQIVYYDPGVGTFGAENAWSRLYRKAGEVWGMLTGWGLDQNVKDAYRFLVEHYESGPDGRDRIHILGFSRGAYTARVLAGFVHAFGLMERRNLNLLDYVYRAYKRVGETGDVEDFAEMRLHERILAPDRPPIRLLGLFDTVASVIEAGRVWPRLRSHAFTAANPAVETVRHALAIHERRTMFTPSLWVGDAGPGRDVREVWFTGVHADVGGGYPEAEAGLAKIPLAWMIDEVRHTGLIFDAAAVDRLVLGRAADGRHVPPDPLARRHRSLIGLWRLAELLPRRATQGAGKGVMASGLRLFGLTVPFGHPRYIPEGARVHGSVIARGRVTGRLPRNLPQVYTVEDPSD